MEYPAELIGAQKAYEKAVAALDRASVREVAAAEKLERAKAVYADTLKAKAYAAEAKAYAAGANKAEKVAI